MVKNVFHSTMMGFHDRYKENQKRSWIMPSEEDLEKLRNMTFCMAGFGGVGTITAELLARWGVRNFRLIDMDQYEKSNMMRQLFATTKTIGRHKAEVAAERIREINPDVNLEMVLCEGICPENVDKLVQGADMVIQTADTPSALLLYKAAERHKVPLVNGYCKNGKSFVQVFDYRHSNCKTWVETLKEKIKWKNIRSIDEMSAEERKALDTSQYAYEMVCPPLNFVTNTTGCVMVSEAVKLLFNKGRVAHYPKRIHLDLVKLTMKVDNPYSLFKLENYVRLFTIIKSRTHLARLQRKA